MVIHYANEQSSSERVEFIDINIRCAQLCVRMCDQCQFPYVGVLMYWRFLETNSLLPSDALIHFAYWTFGTSTCINQ